MKRCPYCKEQIHDEATRCRYCSSRLSPTETASSADIEQVIYVVDKSLVRFAKFAFSILAIFAIVGVYLYGVKIEHAADKVNKAKTETEEARDETSKTRAEAQAIKDDVAEHQNLTKELHNQIGKEADRAKDILRQIRLYEQQAKVKLAQIESPRGTDQQVRDAVDRILLDRLKDVLTPGQLAKFTSPAEAKLTPLSELLDQPALKLIETIPAISMVTNGKPIRVAVIADPIDIDLPQLKDRIVLDSRSGTEGPTGDHGTAVASLIAAISPKALILPFPTLTPHGEGTLDATLAQAIRRAADAKARIACIPLSGTIPSKIQQEAIQYAFESGVLMIAPVGNTGLSGNTPRKEYPAAFAQVLCVASTDNRDKRASFSGYGDWVDISAPGEKIRVLTKDGETTSMSGGSFSAAILAGVAALVLSESPGLSPEQLTEILKENAVPISSPLGAGRVNAAATISAAKSFKR